MPGGDPREQVPPPPRTATAAGMQWQIYILQRSLLTIQRPSLNVSGKSTGFVVTSKVTHASPAPLYAVSPDRSWENDALVPRHARQHGCKDIGAQLADAVGNKIDVSEFLETTGCSADKQWRIQGVGRMACPPRGPNSFIFMQFPAKFAK